jgi:hypothetical protein
VKQLWEPFVARPRPALAPAAHPGGPMKAARTSLILAGLAFGVWETVSAFQIEVPAVAAVFAAGFLGCTAWFWRRDGLTPVIVLALLFGVEAAVAPSLHHVLAITKIAAFALGVAGFAAAVSVLATRRSRTVTA